jgi:hypothetical protein
MKKLKVMREGRPLHRKNCKLLLKGNRCRQLSQQ